MKVNADIVGTALEPLRRRWNKRDCTLYALGIGAGQQDSLHELEFTTDGSGGRSQQAYPTFGVVAGTDVGVGQLLNKLGDAVDVSTMLHGEQELEQFVPLPTEAEVVTTGFISAVWDKGAATVIETVADIVDADDETLYCRSRQSLYFRGLGGWGGDRGPASQATLMPEGPAEVLHVRTRADQPLLYRLSGDPNPLHFDPDVARAAGFQAPIMHGLCVYGIVGRILLARYADSEPNRFGSLSVRFSKPAMPGDILRIEACVREPGSVVFVARDSGGSAVLSNGVLTFSPH